VLIDIRKHVCHVKRSDDCIRSDTVQFHCNHCTKILFFMIIVKVAEAEVAETSRETVKVLKVAEIV
jgi:hypothetical protein